MTKGVNGAKRPNGVEGAKGNRAAKRAKANKARKGGVGAKPVKAPNWFARRSGWQQAGLVLGGTAAGVGAHLLLWATAIPEVGAVVGRVPVLSTVVGWLFAGGAFAALGVLALNHDSVGPAALRRLKIVAGVWAVVGLLCIPTGFANDVVLPIDYWAGVYAGAYGVAAVPLVFFVVTLLWALTVKVLRIKNSDPTNKPVGWVLIAYSALLLVWGSSLLRM
ncbi:hypothetical protein BN6_68790 [Saccharothrix espanaensis DSM 44229]|uniref:Uncharacterized protein n=1 Tax=Saccharothrix espanaensis (strain ATCC 51144 / DSM 44229 / JCM 9112 / NBRC 15066 / NRRL 15764) TaxID=1179773 RepID=K0K727_SACES|nr:hypothetical protein BN6_68790 [Saccharothrix espanaensis DSM 44229]